MFIVTLAISALVVGIAISFCLTECFSISRSQDPEVNHTVNYIKMVFWSAVIGAFSGINCWVAYLSRSQSWRVEAIFVLIALSIGAILHQVFDLLDHVICRNTGNARPTFLRQLASKRGWIG